MPTIELPVQADGFYPGWSSLSEGTEGFLMVDDSAGLTHDSDLTHLILPKLAGSEGIISFPCFRMAEGFIPTSIVVRVVSQIETVTPILRFGFCTATGTIGLSGNDEIVAASYGIRTEQFLTNPITSAAWTEADLIGLEVLVQSKAAVVASTRITLVSVLMTYTRDLFIDATPEPTGFQVA